MPELPVKPYASETMMITCRCVDDFIDVNDDKVNNEMKKKAKKENVKILPYARNVIVPNFHIKNILNNQENYVLTFLMTDESVIEKLKIEKGKKYDIKILATQDATAESAFSTISLGFFSTWWSITNGECIGINPLTFKTDINGTRQNVLVDGWDND